MPQHFAYELRDSEGTYTAVNFIDLTTAEKRDVLTYRNHPVVSMQMVDNHIIGEKEHFAFIGMLEIDLEKAYWLVKFEDNKTKETNHIGVIYFNNFRPISRTSEMGVYTNPYSKASHKGAKLMRMLKFIAFKYCLLDTLTIIVYNEQSNTMNSMVSNVHTPLL